MTEQMDSFGGRRPCKPRFAPQIVMRLGGLVPSTRAG